VHVKSRACPAPPHRSLSVAAASVMLVLVGCDPVADDDAGLDAGSDAARIDTPAAFLDASAAVGDWLDWDPASPGPFAVGYRSFDHTYTPAGHTAPRTIHVSVWYPTLLSEGPVARYSGTSVDRDAIAEAPLAESIYEGGSYPVHVYSHGDRGWGGTSAFLMRRFASHGWVAVAPDHTGNTLTGNLDPRPPWLYYVRSTDVTAALDAIGALPTSDALSGRLALAEVIASGHSFGTHTMWACAGATFDVPSFADDPCSTCTEEELAAFAAGVGDPRIVGIIPMAGAINRRFFGDTGHQSVSIPVLAMSGTADPVGADGQFTTTSPLPFTWIDIEGACHQFFALGCEGDAPLDEDTIVGGFALAFARRHVLGDDSSRVTEILDGSRVLSDRVHFMSR